MPFLLTAFGFIKSYWKPILGIALVIGLYFVAYNNGKRACQLAAERAIRTELERRWSEYLKANDNLKTESDKIDEDRRLRPADDARDSCLLSNDPFAVRCVQ